MLTTGGYIQVVVLKILSDIHGEYGSLESELDREDTAILLGDYLNLIDFDTNGGILSEVFSKEVVAAVMAVLATEEGRELAKSVRGMINVPAGQHEKMKSLMREGYKEFFEAIPCRCIMLYGNTDDPALLEELKSDNVELLRASSFELEGQVFGFISGVPTGKRTVGLPGEIPEADYNGLVDSLGRVDVLCTHFPPAVPELTWDVKADRDEYGSEKLLSYIEEHEPWVHYFGHVHNPRAGEAVHGKTKLINAGFFRAHRTALRHEPGRFDVIP